MDPVSQFQQLLTQLMNPENEARSAAEATLEQIPAEQRASLMFQTAINPACEGEIRSLVLVLLRRLLSNEWEGVWSKWSAELRTSFKTDLLRAAQQESVALIRKRYCDVIAEVARNLLDDQGNQTWPEVLKFLHDCASSADINLKVVSLTTLENVPGIFGIQQSHYISVIKDMLEGCLSHSELEVRSSAVRAATSFLCDNDEDPGVLRLLKPCIPLILKVCATVVEQESDDDTSLQCLSDLATTIPKSLKEHLIDICTLCLKTVGEKEKEDGFRHSALEVLVGLCESSPPMMRKQGARFLPQIVDQCLSMMVELEEDEDWADTDTLDEDEENNASVGETSLDRVACALGGRYVLTPCLQTVAKMLQNGSWQYRHAGLMAVSTVGEGSKKTMESHLDQIVDTILPFLHDLHPRVRYAACNAFGQMASDFAPQFEKKYDEKVIPALLTLLDDLKNPRVAAHAGAALVNFAEDAPKSVMLKHLTGIMDVLKSVLQRTFQMLLETSKKLVLEQVITTMASVADSVEEKFTPSYDAVMPPLKYILEHANQTELRLLRGKTIECISFIGLAVGKDKFLPDATDVMRVLLASQANMGEMEADDPQVSYMISASARICKLLGRDFAQYLPLVLPAVIKAAEFKPEVAVVDGEDADSMSDETDWQFVDLGDQSLGIRTAGLEDKANACQMLVCYARELQDLFADYVEQVTRLFVPLLKFYFHDSVRSAAAEALPYLLKDGAPKGQQFIFEMWQFIFPELLKVMDTEPDHEVLADHMLSMAKCIETLGAGCLSDEQMGQILTTLISQLDKHFKRAQDRNEKRKDEDHDEEQETELEDEDEEDNYVLSKVSDIIHSMFSTHKDAVVVHFEKLLPYLTRLLEPGHPFSDRQWAICIFDDLIEYAVVNSVKYQPYFLEPMLRALEDRAAEVRQAAAYGFGVMGMVGENAYAQACAEALPRLARMIEDPSARLTGEASSATENAVSAVAKILKYNASMVESAPVIAAFLNWLPVYEDKEETPHTFGYFCDLVESNHPVALGDNNSNLPRILLIIAEAFRRDAFDETGKETAKRMCNIVQHVQIGGEGMFQACLSHMHQDQQMALHQALTTYAAS